MEFEIQKPINLLPYPASARDIWRAKKGDRIICVQGEKGTLFYKKGISSNLVIFTRLDLSKEFVDANSAFFKRV